MWALKKLEMYLLGRKTKIITDHKAALWIREKEDFGNARIQRWMETLQCFDFSIEYRKGEEMYEADVLSRLHIKKETVKITAKQEEIIKQIHEETGHRGIDVTEYALKKHFTTWNGQKSHIKEVLDNCEICVRNKTKQSGGSEFIETERKMQKLGVDILEYDNVYLLIGIDYYTRFMMGSVLKSKNSKEINEKLVMWFKKLGNPEELIMDEGLEFDNQVIEEMCLNRGIKRHVIAVEHHKGNGRVERLNRTLRDYFRKNDPNKKMDKNELLGRAIATYNETMHSAIKISPQRSMGNKRIKQGA